MAQGGQVTDNLVEHHSRLAAGGIGMTTEGYLAVSADGMKGGLALAESVEVAKEPERAVQVL